VKVSRYRNSWREKARRVKLLRFLAHQLRLIARLGQRARTAVTTTYPLANFNLQLFFEDALRWQNNLERQKTGIRLGQYYEFGVYRGGTFLTFHRALKAVRTTTGLVHPVKLFAFDSFQGLPAAKSVYDQRPFWTEEQYACSEAEFRRVLRSGGLREEDVVCVPGFYESSLTPALARRLADDPPGIITIDCDLYASTATVLEWLRPLLRHGTLFYFDDIWAFLGHPEYGEMRAIAEFNAKGAGLLVEHHFSQGSKRIWIYTNPAQVDLAPFAHG